ncbi:bifunctional Ribosomal protein L27 [Babesia duncani]|uniref:Bifunctional Ribosomal protein L27 n=1 Tax=Babesia duncani TaxID=323732 RepID=A0AAD9ULX7_9APIC|nr:bifunctional Ribosomal protein L27 [Babesia duncani]KAK2195132.1 bifunctional Ribosomal protein L27 [Babesia duncani]
MGSVQEYIHSQLPCGRKLPKLKQIKISLRAHKTGTGNTRNGRDSRPKFLGIKKYHNSYVFTGNIIIRQRGARFKPGIGTFCVDTLHTIGVTMGRDYTISAIKCGRVQILRRKVSVLDLEDEKRELKKLKECEYLRNPTLTELSRIWTSESVPEYLH